MLQTLRYPDVTAQPAQCPPTATQFRRSQLLKGGSDALTNSGYAPIHVRPDPVSPVSTARKQALFETFTRKPSSAPAKPQWLSLDDKVLRFFGYFCEAAIESPSESRHVRSVVIDFFPADDTMMVMEPRVPNSGFQGGTLIKRHRIPATAEQLLRRQQRGVVTADKFVTINDLNVGEDVECYGKVFHLVDCDEATRRFLTDLGLNVPAPEPVPTDEYFSGHRKTIEMSIRPRMPLTWADRDMKLTFEHNVKGRTVTFYPEEIAKTQKFLRDDGKVLCFAALWDDRENEHGDLRAFHLKYYLADDTVEVIERQLPNAGRDTGRAFAHRNRLPKSAAARSVNLTFTGRVNGTQATGSPDDFYTVGDFYVGAVINVFGRQFLLLDCDPYTRSYYREQLGFEQPPALEITDQMLPRSDPPLPTMQRTAPQQAPPKLMRAPPHNGFGTEEDSLGNWKHLQLKAPHRNLQNWMQNDEKVLRYEAVFAAAPTTEDSTRRFMISFYLGDDTIQVTELTDRNSGFLGGKFLKRQTVKKYAGEGPRCLYKWNDFYVGADVNILGHLFRILRMDDYTLRHRYSPETLPPGVDERTLQDFFQSLGTCSNETLLSEIAPDLSDDSNPVVRLCLEFMRDFPGATVRDLMSLVTPYHSAAGSAPAHALSLLQTELENRKLQMADFFRIIATLPRSKQDLAGSNPTNAQSAGINSYQLRRAVAEVFRMELSPEQESALVSAVFDNERQVLTLQAFLRKANGVFASSTLPSLQ